MTQKMEKIFIYKRCIVRSAKGRSLIIMPRESAYAGCVCWIHNDFIEPRDDKIVVLKINTKYDYDLKKNRATAFTLTGNELLAVYYKMHVQISRKLNVNQISVIDLEQIEWLLFTSKLDTVEIARLAGLSASTVGKLRDKSQPLGNARLDTVIKLAKIASSHRH